MLSQEAAASTDSHSSSSSGRRKRRDGRAFFALCLALGGFCACAGVWRVVSLSSAVPDEAGMLFGLSTDGKVFFHKSEEKDTAFVELRGEPCGGVWGKPVDVDASSRAIWVVCAKEYTTEHGAQLEHFLFAKWGWSPTNNHVWWHMMRGGNVVTLDADDDAMWGIDGHGTILWRPAGDVGKQTRWMRVDGPKDAHPLKLIAADNDAAGTWLWCLDAMGALWRRVPGDYHIHVVDKWADRDEKGNPYWPAEESRLKDLKANMGWAVAVDDRGNLLRRSINGTCCVDPESPVKCWCAEKDAPKLSAITDNGDHGLGYYFPYLQHKVEGRWVASANRWLEMLTSRDHGENSEVLHEASQYFSNYCQADTDHCVKLDGSIHHFLSTWRKETKQEWQFWDWYTLKNQYNQCQLSSAECQRPLQHYGAFRERFMQHLFCCSRQLQMPYDRECASRSCRAYDMTCPGSKLLTSDMDCTVFHSHDPGTMITNMSRLAASKFGAYEEGGDLSVFFDVTLFGTWTGIPDEIFRRFDWPTSTKALFEPVDGREGTALWVFRRKCTPSARQAILQKVKDLIRKGANDSREDLDKLTAALRTFVGNLAEGNYGSGQTSQEWDQLYSDYRAVSSVQREGYLTYAATLEVIGRQQVGLATTFAEDFQCMRQASFFEQLAFIVQHIQTDVPEDISVASFGDGITNMLLKSGKYFDGLLEVGGYDEGENGQGGPGAVNARRADTSVLSNVLRSVYGSSHLEGVLQEIGADVVAAEGTAAFDEAEIRRKACMDIAMWGNAVRHMDAFRRDMGDLIHPMVSALFTCLVHPNATRGSTLKQAMLHAIDVWADAVPPLQPSRPPLATRPGRGLALGLALAGLAALAAAARRRRRVRAASASASAPSVPPKARHGHAAKRE